jgi:hypothetical protein
LDAQNPAAVWSGQRFGEEVANPPFLPQEGAADPALKTACIFFSLRAASRQGLITIRGGLYNDRHITEQFLTASGKQAAICLWRNRVENILLYRTSFFVY